MRPSSLSGGVAAMPHYIALIHKDADSCYGVSFPDWPGVITAGDTIDEAMQQAAEVLTFAAEDWESRDGSTAIAKHIPDGAMGLVVSAISRVGAIMARPTSIAIVAALLFAANLFAGFPGAANDDSNSQYAQAVDQRFNDWHPPIMAWLWSVFRLLADGNGPMFCFHVACYWLGFGLIAVALGRARRPLAAWGIIGVGLFPPFLMMNIDILKDVGLAVTFLAAFAALFWYRIEDRRAPTVVIVISSVLLFYGTLVRSNAVFGVVPLLAYLIHPQWLGRPWRVLVLSAPVAMLMVPVAGLLNHNVLNATPLGIIRSLEI